MKDSDLFNEWELFERQTTTEAAQVLQWALSKFSEMSSDGILGQVFGGGKSTVSIDDVIVKNGILFVILPEWEMSRNAAQLLGSFIQERVRKAVYRRARGGQQQSLFSMYVDEFQNFATTDFDEMLAESRKFGLGLTLANQNLQQLEAFSRFTGGASSKLREAVLGNVMNLVLFGSSPSDDSYLSRFLNIETTAIGRLSTYTPIARLLIGDKQQTMTLQIKDAGSQPGLPDNNKLIRERQIKEGIVIKRSILETRIDNRSKVIDALLAE